MRPGRIPVSRRGAGEGGEPSRHSRINLLVETVRS